MIERLVGHCVLKEAGYAVIDVAGVGYGVEMTESALARLAVSLDRSGSEQVLWIHHHVREDTWRLFGFHTRSERLLFQLLLSVNDVGPKVAMAIMGTLTMRELLAAVQSENPEPLEQVPGIGAKKSRLILLTLKNKLPKLLGISQNAPTVPWEVETASPQGLFAEPTESVSAGASGRSLPSEVEADLRSALANFGYKEREVAPVIRRLQQTPSAGDLAGLIRSALALLTGAAKPGTRSSEELF